MSNDHPQNICRLCLRHEIHLFSLHDPVFTRMILECTSLEVQQNDNLPQSICKTCFASVEFSHQFRKQCLKSDEILRNCVTGQNSLTLSSFISDEVKEEHHTKDIKLEHGIGNNSAIKHEEQIIKREIDDILSNHSGIEDHHGESIIDDIELDTNEFEQVIKKRKLPSKRKSKPKEQNAKVVKKQLKEKKLPSKRKSTKGAINAKINKNNPLLRFQCDYCGKAFRKKNVFQNHVRIHTGEKPYVCEICPKAFAVKHQLQTHFRTHTRERPFPCKFCGKRFLDHSARNRHQNIHTNDKKHPCTHCSKRFMTKYDLNKHVVRHTGGKFHECPVCFQSYADASSLSNHSKTHTLKHTQELPMRKISKF